MNNEVVSKWKALLLFVFENKYSDFYRVKFQKAGFNPPLDFHSLEDVKKIPFLTREDLASVDTLQLLFVPEKEVTNISSTSGTSSSKPLILFRSMSEASPQSVQGISFGHMLVLSNQSRSFQKREELTLIGDIHNLPASCALAAKLDVTTIATTPTLAIILKQYLDAYPDLTTSLKYFRLGGEVLTPYKKKLIQQLYPKIVLYCSYGAAEVSRITLPCQYLTKREDGVLYHPHVARYYIEIINGELVITDFYNHGTPIIRYKIGDLASFLENDCPCGSPGPLLQILGRVNHDVVRAGGFELRRDTLEKPLLRLQEYVRDSFEAHVYERFIGTTPSLRVVLNLSLREGIEESPALTEKVTETFLDYWRLSPRFNARQAVEAGLFEPLCVRFVTFPHSGKARGSIVLH